MTDHVGFGVNGFSVKEPAPTGVSNIPDALLLERAVRNARLVKREDRARERQMHARWEGVMDVFALGSTYARELCKRFDLDPDEQVQK